MSCHRPTARHCSCTPEAPQELLLLATRDPRAAAALRALAAPLDAEVTATAPGVLEVRGDVAALVVAAASALPVAALPGLVPRAVPAPRPEPVADLPRRAELLEQLDRELARLRPGTALAVVFCGLAAGAPHGLPEGAPAGPVIGVAAARIRRALRRSDLLAHCGGGRFVALVCDLPDDAAEEVAARTAASVRACLDEPVATGGGLFPLHPSVGVLVHAGGAAGTRVPVRAADLLAAVDRALEGAAGTSR